MPRTLKSEIIEKLKKGDKNLVMLAGLREHRANIIYDLKTLVIELKIRAYIKIDPKLESKSMSGDIWFHYTENYSIMEDVCDLIDHMHGKDKIAGDISARLTFKSLYVDRGMKTEAVRKKVLMKMYMPDSEKENVLAVKGFTEEHIKEMIPTRKELEKDAERLAGLLSMGVAGLREKVAYCLTHKIIHKNKRESYPLYNRAIQLKII